MKFHLASELQHRLIEKPPAGWTVRSEVGLLDSSLTRLLGYSPTVDLLLQSTASSERIWIELEISRADPVANHAKFASSHLINPLPESDTFVSLVSNDVAPGRSNLAAHAIHLLRVAGLRAFQMPLFPSLDGPSIKRINQGHLTLSHLPDPEIREVIELTRPLGRAGNRSTEIFYATNRLEALLNVNQWNRDMADAEKRGCWGRRKVRYLLTDSVAGTFAPSKFCAYTRLVRESGGLSIQSPCMTIPAYADIEQDNSIFDGQKARLRLAKLGFQSTPAAQLPSQKRSRLKNWAALHQATLILDLENTVILQA